MLKLTWILTIVFAIQIKADNLYSQINKIDLNVSDMSLEEIIWEIKNKTEFDFFYSSDDIKEIKELDVKIKNATIYEILSEVLNETNLEYKVINKTIIIKKSVLNDPIKPELKAQFQQLTIKGKVTDAEGTPLPGVNVVEKGTTNGAITNLDGEYTIVLSSPEATLSFSYVGFLTEEVVVAGKTTIDLTLIEDIQSLEEVVVIGYGIQKKVNLTGSVNSIDFADEIESRPVTNVSTALAGLSSGVTIQQSVGKPGEDGASIRIRGLGTLNNNNPLVIVDGMEGSIDAVNPEDIASISILKDAASSAIYGSRAANGVILITTKKGSRDKTTVNYSGNFSMASPINLLEFISDYPTYMRMMNESARNLGSAEIFSNGTISDWETANANPNGLNDNGVPNWLAYPNTNWAREMYNTNLVQDHNLSVNGGNEKSIYMMSLGFLDNPGLVENTGINRYSYRINMESNVTKWLTVGTRSYAIQQDKELGNYSSMLSYMRQTTPGLVGEYNGQYGYPEATEESPTANNLYGFLNGREGNDRLSRINTTFYSKIDFFEGLSWNLNFNYNRRFDKSDNHTNANAAERFKFSNGQIMKEKTPPSLMTTYYRTFASESYTLENLLMYTKTFNDNHDFSSLLGYNENYYFQSYQNATKKGLIDQNVSTFSSATEMISINGDESDYSIRSLFGRLNYGFKQKYLVEANFRYDGSSRFHPDTRWGFFPSFSGAWRISEESFFNNLSSNIQNLKVRASWGKLGNNASGNYDYQSVYGPVGYSFNGIQVAGLRPTKIANPLLEWESTTMSNIGIDVMTFNSRLNIELDLYNKLTDGILTVPPIYLTAGLIEAPTRNTAEVSNKGFEITLGWRDMIGEVSYSLSGNFSYNKNEVTKYKGKLDEGWRIDESDNDYYYSNLGDVSSGGRTRIVEDHLINEYYILDLYSGSGNHFNSDGSVNINGGPTDGMIRTEEDMQWLQAMVADGYQFYPNQSISNNGIWYGDYIYADSNEDGIYGNSYDKEFTGTSSMPKFIFGINMNVSWKNIDLGMLWSGQGGNELYWLEGGYNRSETRLGFQIGELVGNDHYYYNDDNSNDSYNNIVGKYPRLKLGSDPQNTQDSRTWLYNGSYVKLRNLTVGYTLPSSIANKIFTQKVRIYFSAENLLTITSFPGLDPEMGGYTNYPIMKQISFGTNITF